MTTRHTNLSLARVSFALACLTTVSVAVATSLGPAPWVDGVFPAQDATVPRNVQPLILWGEAGPGDGGLYLWDEGGNQVPAQMVAAGNAVRLVPDNPLDPGTYHLANALDHGGGETGQAGDTSDTASRQGAGKWREGRTLQVEDVLDEEAPLAPVVDEIVVVDGDGSLYDTNTRGPLEPFVRVALQMPSEPVVAMVELVDPDSGDARTTVVRWVRSDGSIDLTWGDVLTEMDARVWFEDVAGNASSVVEIDRVDLDEALGVDADDTGAVDTGDGSNPGGTSTGCNHAPAGLGWVAFGLLPLLGFRRRR